jgi:hypothetical protein
MPAYEPKYIFPDETIKDAELAVNAILPDVVAVPSVVKTVLAVAAITVDKFLADAEELLSTSMGVNLKFADQQVESDEILSEIKTWYARAQSSGEYSSKLTDLGRLLASDVYSESQRIAIEDDGQHDARSIVDKFIIEFDANAGLHSSLAQATGALTEIRQLASADLDISPTTRTKLRRILSAGGDWLDDTSHGAWDAAAAARAGAVAHIEYLIDGLPTDATIGQLRNVIDQWRSKDFATAVPDIDRDVYVVLAQLVQDLDNIRFEAHVGAGEAMAFIRDTLLVSYRKVILRP